MKALVNEMDAGKEKLGLTGNPGEAKSSILDSQTRRKNNRTEFQTPSANATFCDLQLLRVPALSSD